MDSQPVGDAMSGIFHRTIWRCALADLRHEWALNLCVVLGIAALVFPVAVLYGLKHGAVSVLQSRLQNDPRSRELRPASSGFFDRAWIEARRNDLDVAFAVGLPRTVAATVRVRRGDDPVDASILPTGPGDPLLESGGLAVPAPGECVVSSELAREGDLRIGERIDMMVSRRGTSPGGAWEEVSTSLKITGILPPAALDYPALLTPPETAEAVEDFLDGLAVPVLGWPGEVEVARPAYDGALVVFVDSSASARDVLAARIGGTGFTTILEYPDAGNGLVFHVSNANRMVDETNLRLLREKLGDLAEVAPWLESTRIQWTGGGGEVPVILRAWSPVSAKAGLAPSWPKPPQSDSAGTLPWRALSNGADGRETEGDLRIRGVAGLLELPVRVRGAEDVAPGELWLEASVAGLVRRAEIRGMELRDGKLVYTRRGYAAFRIAARSLFDVPEVRARLEARGIPVLADTQRIADLQFLDHQLNRIFTLFAIVAGAGAVTCLWAIAFSAAERKKRVLAFLQILGATRWQAARFPLYQALCLSLAGAGTAWLAHEIFSRVVNSMFVGWLLPGERLSELPVELVLVAGGILMGISLGCYLLLIPRFVGLPLGEAAREP